MIQLFFSIQSTHPPWLINVLPIEFTAFATLNILFHDLKIASLRQCEIVCFNLIHWEFDINYVATDGKTIWGEEERLTDQKLRKLISSKEGK